MYPFNYNILAQRPDVEFWFTIIIFVIIIVANAIKSISKANKDKKDMQKRQAQPQPQKQRKYKPADKWSQRSSTQQQRSAQSRYDLALEQKRKQANLRRERMIQAQRQHAAELDRQRQQRMQRLQRQNELIRQKEEKQKQALRQVQAVAKKTKPKIPRYVKPTVVAPVTASVTQTPSTPQTSWFSINDLSDMQAEQLRDLFVVSEILGQPKALIDM